MLRANVPALRGLEKHMEEGVSYVARPCTDCGLPMRKDTDYYMVTYKLWCSAFGVKYRGRTLPNGCWKDNRPEGIIHIKCLEKRIGRPLRRRDFPKHIPINVGVFGFHRDNFPK